MVESKRYGRETFAIRELTQYRTKLPHGLDQHVGRVP